MEETNKLFQTAGDETLQLSQPSPVWQWLTNDNTWDHYLPEQSNKLESAYLQHGTACVILHINSIKYSVNTKSRIQTNTSTGKQRKVQRSVKSVSPPPRTSTPTPPSVKTRPSFIKPIGTLLILALYDIYIPLLRDQLGIYDIETLGNCDNCLIRISPVDSKLSWIL